MIKKQIKKMLLHESVLLIIPCLYYYGCGRNLDGLFVSTDIVCEWINLFSICSSFYSITDLRCLLNNNTYYNFCYLSKNSMQKFVGGTDQNGRLILKCPSIVTFHPLFSMKFLATATFRGSLGFTMTLSKEVVP